MPVRRYHDVSEMEERWYEPGDPLLGRAIRRLWELGQRTMRPRFPHGVYKHRGIEEMSAQTERWAAANFEAFKVRRAAELERLTPR